MDTAFSSNHDVDIEETEMFLKALGIGPEEKIPFRTFDDVRERGNKSLTVKREGSLRSVATELAHFNALGAGIFFTVNRTDGSGVKTNNIVAVRCVFVDLDGAPLDLVKACSPRPHCIVESSPGRAHAYWLVIDCGLEKFTPIQKAMARKFNSDPSVSDLPRTMRLPGFFNQKKPDQPFLTRILEINAHPPYTVDELVNGLGLVLEEPKKQGQKGPATEDGDLVPKYKRHNWLTHDLMPRLRNAGLTGEALFAATRAAVYARCEAPDEISDKEIQDLCDWFDKKEGAKPPETKFTTDHEELIRDNLSKVKSRDMSFLDDSAFVGALALAQEHRPALYADAIHAAGGKDSVRRYLENEVRKHSRKLRVVSQGESDRSFSDLLKTIGHTIRDGADRLKLPDRYVADLNGLARISIDKNGTPHRQDLSSRLWFMTGRSEDAATGNVFINTTFQTDTGWTSLTAPRGDLMDRNRIMGLADKGAPVFTGNAGDFCKFFHDFEELNLETLPTEKFVSRFGWVGDSFIWGTEQIAPAGAPVISFHGADAGDEQLARSLHAGGSYDEWVSAAAELASYPKARVALYASFVPPTLKMVDALNIGIDLSGKTSTGKTTAACAAASVWGRPVGGASDEDFLGKWENTKVGLERRCGLLNDLPVILDDTKTVQPKFVGNAIYSIMSGHGRGRGSIKGMAQTSRWRTCLISTGEAAAVSYSNDAGQRARMVTITGLPFEKEDAETRKLVRDLNRAFQYNYGHAGPRFVRWLVDNPARWDDFQKLFRAQAEIYTADSGVEARQADICAVISTAGRLAHEALDLPWCFSDPFTDLWPMIQAQAADVDIDIRAMRDIYAWCISQEQFFYGRHPDDGNLKPRQPACGWHGRWDNKPNWPWIGIFLHVLTDQLKRMEYDVEAVMAGWCQRKWLTRNYPLRMAGKNVRMPILHREAIEPNWTEHEDAF